MPSAYDSQRRRIFSSNGSGSLTVIRADGPDKYTLLGEEPTQLLARTMTLDPVSGRIFMLAGERIEGSTPMRPIPASDTGWRRGRRGC